MESVFLSRYEIARIVGLRAMQLESGSNPHVEVADHGLRSDATYMAALELYSRTLDVKVVRNGVCHDVRKALFSSELAAMLDTRDGGARGLDYMRLAPAAN